MNLKIIKQNFSICQIDNLSLIDFSDEFCFISKTDEEVSLVCKTELVPTNIIKRDDGWRAFRIQEMLDFSLIGVLARISSILANNEIGIFVVSTYNTDYVLTKEADFEKSIRVLKLNGYYVN